MKLRLVLSSIMIIVITFLASSCSNIFTLKGQSRTQADKTSTISIVINSLGATFPAGLDENSNPYLDYIEKNTGLTVKVNLPPNEVYEDKLNVFMSSGNVPDLLHAYDAVWIDKYMKQDALMPLDDLLNKFGPDLKEKIPEYVWDRVRYNGKIYAIPSLNEVMGVELMYARKDWLDRLGFNPPVTLDEYYEVIKAFTLNDPDGNGINDTHGLILTENLGRSAPFFGAYGVQLDSWLEKDGELVNGGVMPGTKKALSYLAKLYKEKLLDPEFPLNRLNNLNEKIANGKVGLFSAAWYDTRGPIADNKKKDPNAEWIALEYPTGPDGQKGVYDRDVIRGYNIIPRGAVNPEGVIRFLNFIVGEGYKSLKLGFENEIWSMQDGVMVTNFEEHDKHVYRGMYQSLVDVEDAALSKERLDSLGDYNLYNNLQKINDNLIKNKFYGSPTPAMITYKEILQTQQDMFIKIVMGIEPIDSFDQYVEKWKHEGGDEMTREVNEWFKKQDSVEVRKR